MLIKEIEEKELKIQEDIRNNFVNIKKSGVCATCKSLSGEDIFKEDERETLYEDNLFLVKLEKFPRREGHIIIILKPYFEDISYLREDLYNSVMKISITVINDLKKVLNAHKVYFLTMCDEGVTHLHFQLIPNFPNMPHGSKVLVNERKSVNHDMELITLIRNEIKENLNK